MHQPKMNFNVSGIVSCAQKGNYLQVSSKKAGVTITLFASTVPVTIQPGEINARTFFIKPFDEEVGLILARVTDAGWYTRLLVVKKGETAPYLMVDGCQEFFNKLFPGIIINFYDDEKMEIVVGDERFSTKDYPIKGTRVVDAIMILNFLLKRISLEELIHKAPKTKEELLKEELDRRTEKFEKDLRFQKTILEETRALVIAKNRELDVRVAELLRHKEIIETAMQALTNKYSWWWGQVSNALKILRTN